jgi:putative SOS response-associated peptidase YedK
MVGGAAGRVNRVAPNDSTHAGFPDGRSRRHHPVILPEAEWSAWLDPQTERQHLDALLVDPPPSRELVSRPVSMAVNNARYDGPECVAPA